MRVLTSVAADGHEARKLSHLKYRPDIDGLRAVAVLSVICFHAFPSFISGGFVGVDVFFVISGFLISSIIFSNFEKDKFSFIEFYVRRIRRIFPSLIVVLAAGVGFGWFVLLADEYQQLGRHVTGGSLFVSNFILWQESGYFDTAAETKPFLHLWSLGIEEQFYLVFPCIVWLAWKRRFSFLALTVAILVASLLYNVAIVKSSHVTSFYSPFTRFWELMIGGVLAYISAKSIRARESANQTVGIEKAINLTGSRGQDFRSISGVLLLSWSLAFITKNDPFPGWLALLPTVGAVLIISAGPHGWLNRAVLSHRVLVWFGLISFPLYLWHWVLLSFARIAYGVVPDIQVRLVAVTLSIFLAWLTYKYIEKPFRFGDSGTLKAWILIALMSLVSASGFWVFKQDGVSEREVVALNNFALSGKDGGTEGFAKEACGIEGAVRQQVPVCLSDTREPAKYALVGDSKAQSLFPGLVRTSQENNRWLFIGGTSGNTVGVPVISDFGLYARGQTLAHLGLETIIQNPEIKVVAITSATRELFNLKNNYSIEDLPESPLYPRAYEGLNNYVQQIVAAGKKVVLVIDNPTLPDPKNCINRKFKMGPVEFQSTNNCAISIEKHLELSAKYRQMLESIAAAHPSQVRLLDTIPILCEAGMCASEKNGRLLYEYSDHVSDYGAGLIGERLNRLILEMSAKS